MFTSSVPIPSTSAIHRTSVLNPCTATSSSMAQWCQADKNWKVSKSSWRLRSFLLRRYELAFRLKFSAYTPIASSPNPKCFPTISSARAERHLLFLSTWESVEWSTPSCLAKARKEKRRFLRLAARSRSRSNDGMSRCASEASRPAINAIFMKLT